MIKKLLSIFSGLLITSTVFSQTQNVTFQVDNPLSASVYVFGSWSGWSNWPGDLMTDSNGDGVYDKTLPIASGSVEYLYVSVTATDTIKEGLNPAWLCTNGNGQYTNRTLTVGSSAITVCNNWASCSLCGEVVVPYVNVKFQLQNPTASPVYVFGSWSGWSNFPGTLMTLNTSTNLYEASVSVQGDSTIEYLYFAGPDTTKEILDPNASCTNGNGQYTNRLSMIGTNDTTICAQWQTCTACTPTGIQDLKVSDVTVLVNTNGIRVNSDFYSKFNQLQVFDAIGRSIYSDVNGLVSNSNIPVQLQKNTVYFLRLKSNDKVFTFKKVITN